MREPSESLMEIAFFALDHGIESVKAGDPLIPFLVTASGSEKSLQRFAAETLEDCLAQARSHAAELGPEVTGYALAHDGYINDDGERFDALFIEAGERQDEEAVVLAQRYRPKKGLRKFATIGNPAFVARPESRLT